MSAILTPRAGCGHLFIDKTGMLASAHRPAMFEATGEHIVIRCAATALKPCSKASANIAGHLELHGPPRLSLDHNCAGADIRSGHKVTDLEFTQITAAQLAVVGKVEKRMIA